MCVCVLFYFQRNLLVEFFKAALDIPLVQCSLGTILHSPYFIQSDVWEGTEPFQGSVLWYAQQCTFGSYVLGVRAQLLTAVASLSLHLKEHCLVAPEDILERYFSGYAQPQRCFQFLNTNQGRLLPARTIPMADSSQYKFRASRPWNWTLCSLSCFHCL